MKIEEFLEDELRRREDLDIFLSFILFSVRGKILEDGVHSCCRLICLALLDDVSLLL